MGFITRGVYHGRAAGDKLAKGGRVLVDEGLLTEFLGDRLVARSGDLAQQGRETSPNKVGRPSPNSDGSQHRLFKPVGPELGLFSQARRFVV
ncbi:MAG: hypothetical protein ABIK79_05710 [Chloroflexota bacterium]